MKNLNVKYSTFSHTWFSRYYHTGNTIVNTDLKSERCVFVSFDASMAMLLRIQMLQDIISRCVSELPSVSEEFFTFIFQGLGDSLTSQKH
jgi:hypothetical protein